MRSATRLEYILAPSNAAEPSHPASRGPGGFCDTCGAGSTLHYIHAQLGGLATHERTVWRKCDLLKNIPAVRLASQRTIL